MNDLQSYPGVPRDWNTAQAASAGPALPMIPLGFMHGGVVLQYFSLVTSVATPQSAIAQELRLESMFPADEATEARHRALMSATTRQKLAPGTCPSAG